MKAIMYDRFGGLEVLREADVQKPVLAKGQVLVQMKATSINVVDIRTRKGLMSPMVNKKFPKIPGVDVAGIVVEAAPDVTGFKPGDEVFGAANAFKGGAFAEYVAVSAKSLAPKPAGLTFEQAAALPVAGTAAIAAIINLGHVAKGSKVLIHGGSGAVGLAAISIAKHRGAHVTAVAGTQGIDAMKTAGADTVIDYRKPGNTLDGPFDVILNASGAMPYAVARGLLKPHGILVEPSPNIPIILGSAVANPFRAKKHKPLLSTANRQFLDQLAAWAVDGTIKPVIAQTFPLSKARDAFAAMEKGGAVGKIVVTAA